LVRVADQEGKGRSRGLPFLHPAEDFDFIPFLALGDDAALARFPPVQILLDVRRRQGEQRGTAVDDDADCWTVRFPKRRDAKKSPQVARHG
jgi:hypothetical protein